MLTDFPKPRTGSYRESVKWITSCFIPYTFLSPTNYKNCINRYILKLYRFRSFTVLELKSLHPSPSRNYAEFHLTPEALYRAVPCFTLSLSLRQTPGIAKVKLFCANRDPYRFIFHQGKIVGPVCNPLFGFSKIFISHVDTRIRYVSNRSFCSFIGSLVSPNMQIH